ncbi:MAG TPA: prolyl oligopeptidase family serine peptidase [Herpetosiphonaceae bacterium]
MDRTFAGSEPAAGQSAGEALWKQRYRAIGIWYGATARLAPERGLVISAATGAPQLYAWEVASGALRQLTFQPDGVVEGTLAPDGGYVYYLRDQAGGESGHYVRVPWAGGPEQDLTPDLPPYAALYRCSLSDDGRRFAFTPTEPGGFPLYCLDLNADGPAGPPRELHRSPKLVEDALLSPDGALAAIATTEHAAARQYSLAVFDAAGGGLVAELSDLPGGSLRAICFSPVPGERRLLCMADRAGLNQPLIWDLASGGRLELPLSLAGDIEPLDWSGDGRRLLLRQTDRAAQRLYAWDLAAGSLTALHGASGAYIGAQFGAGSEVIAFWGDSTHLPELIKLDAATGAFLGTLLASDRDLPARRFRSVSFRSSDGAEVQGWLGAPDGPGPFPTILAAHGGPHIVEYELYDPGGQAWLDHGYAYLSVNYRGSTTFGREFKEQVWGDLGHWELEDLAAAREWLIAEGVALPDAILVSGGSYGGYLTLMALGKQPGLWAGGLALVAPADFFTEYYEGTDWSKGYLRAMMGGTPEEKPEAYAASSPITYVESVAAPLLVIQGKNDLRCPPRQMELYADKMRALGKPFEIDWFDAGHGAMDLEMVIGFQERFLQFADQILRARRA